MAYRLFAVGVIYCAAGVHALAAADGPIGEAEWRSMTNGKTVLYKSGGKLIGREYYPPNEYFSVFQDAASGACYEGPWAYTEGRFCFLYADNFQCFAHIRRGETIVSKSDINGKEQVIDSIVGGDKLTCGR